MENQLIIEQYSNIFNKIFYTLALPLSEKEKMLLETAKLENLKTDAYFIITPKKNKND